MTNNEVWSYSYYDGEGNMIEQEDIPLHVPSGDRDSQAHHDSQYGVPACILLRETDDRLVSVREVLDTSELVVETVTYDSFGNLLNETNAADDGSFRRYDCDPNVLLSDCCTRAYDPTIGHWLSQEPIGFTAEGGNLDSYVGNNPTKSNE